ncbi:MAG: branched-chain amino acid ABC transporter permease [Dongiaceae bacterium]
MDWSMLADPNILTVLVLQGLVRGAMYALMGIGLSLIFGILGVVNFAHGELFMLGSYVMYLVVGILGMPFYLGIVAAAGVVFVCGVAIERGLVEQLRRRAGRDWISDSFVLTIGLAVVLQNLAHLAFGSRQYGVAELVAGSVPVGELEISLERLAIFGLACLAVLLLWAFMKFARTGRAIRAAAQNAEAAETLGIDVRNLFTVTFGLGAAFAGVAGALLISIYPASPTVGAEPLLKSFAVVVLGGLGNVSGAIAAGLLLGVLEAFTIFIAADGWQNVLTAYLVILVLLVRPAGLFVLGGKRA